jgi:hypothetical protein
MGGGLTDALRLTRTTQIWSYREANRASYIANGDIVKGWIWYADLAQACPACWAMHGKEFPLDEVLDDHHNGHCAMLPLVIGDKNDIPLGTEQFDNLNEEQQRAILGNAKFDAWNDGKFTLADIVNDNKDTPNDVYGPMRTEKSLKDLIGDE